MHAMNCPNLYYFSTYSSHKVTPLKASEGKIKKKESKEEL